MLAITFSKSTVNNVQKSLEVDCIYTNMIKAFDRVNIWFFSLEVK